VSWPCVVKVDLNHALVSLDLVLLTLSVFINCCLGIFVLSLGCNDDDDDDVCTGQSELST